MCYPMTRCINGPAARPGQIRKKLSAVPLAAFAYSNGVKSMEALGTGNLRFGVSPWWRDRLV